MLVSLIVEGQGVGPHGYTLPLDKSVFSFTHSRLRVCFLDVASLHRDGHAGNTHQRVRT